MNSTSFLLTALSNLLGLNPFIGLSFLAFSAYIMGKSAPKLDALIMEKLPADMLAQGNNFLGLLFTLSIPLGTFGFSSLALYHISACWMVFVLVSILSLYLTVNDFKKGWNFYESTKARKIGVCWTLKSRMGELLCLSRITSIQKKPIQNLGCNALIWSFSAVSVLSELMN